MNYYSDGISAMENMRCRGIVHTVRPGDTLYKISRIYGVTVDQLMDSNDDINVYNLQVGSKICVPVSDQSNPSQGFVYRVQPGDNLNNLLKKFNITFEDFETYNPQLMPIQLRPGTVVYLPPEKVMRDIDNDSMGNI